MTTNNTRQHHAINDTLQFIEQVIGDKIPDTGYEDLRAHLCAVLLAEHEAAAKTRTCAPRKLRKVSSGALLDEQQYCYTMGWREGQAALRSAIRKSIILE